MTALPKNHDRFGYNKRYPDGWHIRPYGRGWQAYRGVEKMREFNKNLFTDPQAAAEEYCKEQELLESMSDRFLYGRAAT
jgi:hypothetical protein